MRKIKTRNKPQKKPMSLWTKIIIGAAAAAVVVIVIALLVIESGGEKLIITNDTGMKLEKIEAYFVAEEGKISDPVVINDIEAGDTAETGFEKADLYAMGANLEIRFKFEGMEKELFTDAGIFNDDFSGKVKISFNQINDELIRMKVKASIGLFNSPLIQCDEEYEVNIKTGEVFE
jgi:hypothetical protein